MQVVAKNFQKQLYYDGLSNKTAISGSFPVLIHGTAREVSGLTGSVFRCLIVLFLQAVTLLNRNRLLISGEDVINLALLKLRRDEADNRDDHKTCQHAKRAGVDRTLNIVEEDIAQRDADTGDEAQEPLTADALLPDYASVSFDVTWDGEPALGATARFHAVLIGYDGLDYILQWQSSVDNVNWKDIEGANAEVMDVVITEDNCTLYWRVKVFIRVAQES